MLEVRALNQFYGESHTLWDVELDAAAGEVLCLMGRNGVGKSTLLKSVMGLVPVAGGSVRLGGEALTGRSPDACARMGIGYVPQGREIFGLLTVEENLKIGLAARRDGAKHIPPLVFELFPALKKMLRRRGGDLSGGQQQQLAIGRALATNPRLLILDEPTEGIQPNVVREIGEVIQRLARELKLAVLLVEQKIPFARLVAQRFCILEKGRGVAHGTMDELHDGLIDQHLRV